MLALVCPYADKMTQSLLWVLSARPAAMLFSNLPFRYIPVSSGQAVWSEESRISVLVRTNCLWARSAQVPPCSCLPCPMAFRGRTVLQSTSGVLVQLLGAGERGKRIQESQSDIRIGKKNYLGIVQWFCCWLCGGKEESKGTEEFFPGESSYSLTLKGNLCPGTSFAHSPSRSKVGGCLICRPYAVHSAVCPVLPTAWAQVVQDSPAVPSPWKGWGGGAGTGFSQLQPFTRIFRT